MSTTTTTTTKQPNSHRSENDLNSASNAIDQMISMSTEDPAAITTDVTSEKGASDPSASTKASNGCPRSVSSTTVDDA